MEQLTIIPVVTSSADFVLNVLHKTVNLLTTDEFMTKLFHRTRVLLVRLTLVDYILFISKCRLCL